MHLEFNHQIFIEDAQEKKKKSYANEEEINLQMTDREKSSYRDSRRNNELGFLCVLQSYDPWFS